MYRWFLAWRYLATRPINLDSHALTFEETVQVVTPDPLIQIVQPSKVTVRVSLPLIPIFCSAWPSVIPGDFASTMKPVTRCFVLPSVVTGTFAKTVKTPA